MLHFSSSLFNNLKKSILSNYTSWKRFICLKWNIIFFLQYCICILSSTTIHCRSLPLRIHHLYSANFSDIIYCKVMAASSEYIYAFNSIYILQGVSNKMMGPCFILVLVISWQELYLLTNYKAFCIVVKPLFTNTPFI